jgi:DNA-binding NarL/FixJ family response regulator
VVGFDAYAWLLTDPDTSVGSSPLADVPCLRELPRLILLKYLTALNRWTLLRTPVALAEATGGDLSRSLVWRELLSRYGVTDVASSVHRDHYGCWGFLDVWRIGGRFSARDTAYLADIAAPVTAALRRAQALTFVATPEPTPRGPVVLLLSPDLDVRAQTPETQDYLRILVPPDDDRSPVPASAYNVAAQLRAAEVGVDANPPQARVHLSGGRWLTLRAARIGESRVGSDPDIAVSIEQSSASERAGMFARAYGLSRRESELLNLLVTGSDAHELASRMFVSDNTVNDHLKSIFRKSGVRSRHAVLARALGS